MVLFYVVLTPIWLGLRALAWVAELRSRRDVDRVRLEVGHLADTERRNALTSAGERRRATR